MLRAAIAFLAFCALTTAADFQVPITYYKLQNGLKVVLSRDTTAPTVFVAVYYNIGFRIEPRNRTGFAHLFEHLMFQGSKNLPKGEFDHLVTGNGGILNGGTRFDFTNYYQVIPSHILEATLWAEADRMKNLTLTEAGLKNQQGVVGNEVKVNVLNRPYGGFPWLDMPQYANKNWYNAHNFYGDLADIESATLSDAQSFAASYYVPDNASLALVGDFDEAQARVWIEKYFGGIKPAKLPPKPDLTEPPQQAEQRATKLDKLAQKPALAVAYHMPPRGTPEDDALILIDQIMLQGDDSLLTQSLVKKHGYTDSVDGGINLLGNQFNYAGPMLWTVNLIYDSSIGSEPILTAIDETLAGFKAHPPSADLLNRALVKFRAAYYRQLVSFGGYGRADLLATFALFDDNPQRINSIEKNLRSVTPELIQQTAQQYLDSRNRTILLVQAGGSSK